VYMRMYGKVVCLWVCMFQADGNCALARIVGYRSVHRIPVSTFSRVISRTTTGRRLLKPTSALEEMEGMEGMEGIEGQGNGKGRGGKGRGKEGKGRNNLPSVVSRSIE
jgi:hypothetical protein